MDRKQFDDIDNAEDFRILTDYVRAEASREHLVPDVEKELQNFWTRQQQQPKQPTVSFRRHRLLYTAVAAAVVILCGFFFIHNLVSRTKGAAEPNILVYAANENARYLKLDIAGHTMLLSDAAAAQQLAQVNMKMTGRKITLGASHKADRSNVTLTSPCGEIITLVLPDGTVVKLNAASSITFPRAFSGSQRVIRLRGEAYFDVAHDARRPFIVVTDYFRTQVLGTRFNISAYAPTHAGVTLLEGKVQVHSLHSAPLLLAPEEQAVYAPNGALSKQKADVYQCMQWQKGFFYFDQAPLSEIMVELGRWYNMDVLFRNKSALNERMHFVADRNDKIRSAIDNLNELGRFHISIVKNKLVIQ